MLRSVSRVHTFLPALGVACAHLREPSERSIAVANGRSTNLLTKTSHHKVHVHTTGGLNTVCQVASPLLRYSIYQS